MRIFAMIEAVNHWYGNYYAVEIDLIHNKDEQYYPNERCGSVHITVPKRYQDKWPGFPTHKHMLFTTFPMKAADNYMTVGGSCHHDDYATPILLKFIKNYKQTILKRIIPVVLNQNVNPESIYAYRCLLDYMIDGKVEMDMNETSGDDRDKWPPRR